jgi:Fe-S cluster assembly protein SufD
VILDAPSWNHAQTPAWFAEMQQTAWHEFASLPLPSRKDEAWRFADLTKLKFDHFNDAPAADTAVVARLIGLSQELKESAGRVIFVNDRLVHIDSQLAACGISVETLATGFDNAKHLLNSISSRLGSGKFVSLHQAHLRNATVITAAKNAQLAAPVEIYHWVTGNNASVFPRTIISAGENSRVSIVEHHQSADATSVQFSCGAAQLVAGRGASIDYVLSQNWNHASKSIHLSSTHCGRDSRVNHCLVNLGSAWGRTECVSHLEGPGSRSDMLSVSLTDQDQEMDQRTLQLHHAPHAQSDLLYKNVLFGKSRSIFAGLISVDEGAHFTDAYQTCRNLLMTDECEANAMPGLEINADQVKCSHGSTSGAISEEEIFYFESRGIPEQQARALLAQGFLAQTLERLGSESVREFLVAKVAAKFEQNA